MFPKGTIYDSKGNKSNGVVKIAATFLDKVVYGLLRGLGAGIIAFFVLWFLFSTYPIVKNELSYFEKNNLITKKNSDNELKNMQYLLEAQTTQNIQAEASKYGISSNFSIVIPKIDAKSQILANVDTSSEQEYFDALKKGVAHARGTYFPGQGKTIYLFAHSTDYVFNVSTYNAIFYLLRKLEIGDDVMIYFSDRKYIYRVSETIVTEPTDVTWLTKDFGKEKLILQTCYPPGTRLKRLLVLADLVSN